MKYPIYIPILFLILLMSVKSIGQDYELETVIQRGHRASVTCLSYSPDGKFIVTGSRDQTIKLWETSSGREVRSFLGHESTVRTLTFNSSGTQIASGGLDNLIIIWEVSTGKELQRLEGHTDRITSVTFSPDGSRLASGGYDWNAFVWDLETGTKESEIKVNPDKGTGYGVDLEFDSKGQRLFIGGDNGMMILYDIEKQLRLDTLRNLELGWCGGCPTLIKTTENDKTLLTASNKGPLSLWDLSSGSLIREYGKGPRREYKGLGYSTNYIIAVTIDSIFTWTRNGRLVSKFKTADHETNQAGFDPVKKQVSAALDNNTSVTWDYTNGKKIKTFSGILNIRRDDGLGLDPNSYWDYNISRYVNYKNQFSISPDGTRVVMGKYGPSARMWEISSGRVVKEFTGHDKVVLCQEFSSDGKKLITGGGDGKAILWDLDTGDSIRSFKGHSEMILSMSISDNQNYLATGGWDGKVIVWDIQTGQKLHTIRLTDNSAYALSFMQNDLYLAIAGLDKTLKLYELDTGLPVRDMIGHKELVSDVEADETVLLSSGWDGKVKLWDLGTGLAIQKFSGHKGRVYSAQFSSDHKWIVTAGQDRRAIIWERESGKKIKEFQGHKDEVTAAQFIKKDQFLITNSLDGTTRIWDVKTGKEIVTHILVGKKDWLVKTSAGFFDATEGAKKNIFFVRGMKSYSLDQFFEDFYRPGIMNESLKNRGLLNYNFNIKDKLQDSPPPSIEIISPKTGELLTNKDIELVIKVQNNGGGVSEVKLLHNGKRISDAQQQLPRGSRRSIYQTYPLQLITGRNIIEVSSFSNGRIESDPEKLDLIVEGVPEDITCHVIAVGINQYKNPSLNLNYAYADAESFYKLIKQKGKKLFNRIELYPLFDEDATREKILETLEIVAGKARPQDVFFFYYAGHGSMVDGDFYFIPTNNIRLYDKEELDANGLYAGEMQAEFSKIHALKQMVLIDACQSGGSTEILASRGASEEKAMAQLSRSSGVHVLAASGSEQFATEFKELGHGLFTYVLLEALEGKADGAPKDGKVTIYELKSYIDDQVPEYSIKYKGKPQYPVTYSKGQDFPIVIE